jgi:hypothetical protein
LSFHFPPAPSRRPLSPLRSSVCSAIQRARRAPGCPRSITRHNTLRVRPVTTEVREKRDSHLKRGARAKTQLHREVEGGAKEKALSVIKRRCTLFVVDVNRISMGALLADSAFLVATTILTWNTPTERCRSGYSRASAACAPAPASPQPPPVRCERRAERRDVSWWPFRHG